jgi:hypothetical protein
VHALGQKQPGDGSASNVTVFVIFDGKGRLKNSVKRSLRNFDKVNVDRVQVDDPDAKCAARTAATPARARTARTAATAAMAATAGTKGTASTFESRLRVYFIEI